MPRQMPRTGRFGRASRAASSESSNACRRATIGLAFGWVATLKCSMIGSSPPERIKPSHRLRIRPASGGRHGSRTGTPPASLTAAGHRVETRYASSWRSTVMPMRGGGMGAGGEACRCARRISAHLQVSSENTLSYHPCGSTADRRYDGGGNVGWGPVGGNQKEGEENRIRRVSATSLIVFAGPGAADSASRPFLDENQADIPPASPPWPPTSEPRTPVPPSGWLGLSEAKPRS